MTNLFKILIVSALFFNHWATYKPHDESFSITFPQDYHLTQDSLRVDVGTIPISQVYHFCNKGAYCGHDDFHTLYSLIYMDYPANTFHRDSLRLGEELFKETLNTRLREMHGALDYSSDINNEQYQGQLFRITSDSLDQVCKGKFILHEDRFIAIQVLTNKENKANQDVTTFLESFRIIE